MANEYILCEWRKTLDSPEKINQFVIALHQVAGFADGFILPPGLALQAIKQLAAPRIAETDRLRTKFIGDLESIGGK